MKFIIFMLCAICLLSCSEAERNADDRVDGTPTASETKIESSEAVPPGDVITTTQGYTLREFQESPSFPDARIIGYDYKDGKFEFRLSESDYVLGSQTSDAASKMCANSAKGQHIHLIIDNEPYAAKYESTFEHKISDGEHYLLAFLSRSYHESIKTDAAHVAEKIMVKDGSIVDREPITDPMLFYSRPKGTYVGEKETKHVMLDFYAINAEIGKDYDIRMIINDRAKMVLDEWKPYFIEGLGLGKNSITLSLIPKDGAKTDIPLLPVTREFTLQGDPQEQ